jgi:hypothetical protein
VEKARGKRLDPQVEECLVRFGWAALTLWAIWVFTRDLEGWSAALLARQLGPPTPPA